MKYVALAGAALLAASAGASAQTRTMQFDVNSLNFQAFSGSNGTGSAVAFGGLTHSGSLVLTDAAAMSVLNAIGMQSAPAGAFAPQAFTGSLTDATVTINLSNGAVTGGALMLQVGSAPGDMYMATIGGAGMVTNFVGGGFKIEGLTSAGTFSDNDFAGVPIADFFAAQGSGGLTGSFLNFRIQPNAGGAGNADIDVFVNNIPSPGSLALLGLGAGVLARRRRR